ncbi:hypothetical protein [Rhizobium giardinii]
MHARFATAFEPYFEGKQWAIPAGLHFQTVVDDLAAEVARLLAGVRLGE